QEKQKLGSSGRLAKKVGPHASVGGPVSSQKHPPDSRQHYQIPHTHQDDLPGLELPFEQEGQQYREGEYLVGDGIKVSPRETGGVESPADRSVKEVGQEGDCYNRQSPGGGEQRKRQTQNDSREGENIGNCLHQRTPPFPPLVGEGLG